MSQRLYIQVGHTYTLCRPTPQPHVFQFSKVAIPFESLPLDSQPVEVSPTDNSEWWQVKTVQRPPIPLPHRMPITATFADFVDTLAPWEIDLLRHTTMHVDPYTLCDAMTPGVKGGSDGSVRYHTEGSFGWVISSEHGERVAQGKGPVRSPRPTSYRAEASGLLSLLRFLLRASEFTSMVDPWKGTIVTDSYRVLKTLGGGDVDPQDALDKPIKIDGDKVVLDVLCPEWDLLIEIQHALIHLPEMTLQFIKGHQDAKTPYAQLPLDAQLNCDADHIAGEYQDQYGGNRPILLMSPCTQVLIHLPEGSITGKFANALRTAYCGPPLLNHMKARYKWSDATADSINWDAHGTCLGRTIARGSHYTKMVHENLPTHSWLNKMDKGIRVCPCCPEKQEDRDHIWRCPAVARNQWRHAFLQKVADYCTTQSTYPPIQILLIDAMREWLYTDPAILYEPDPTQYPQHLHPVIASQSRIGWRQLFSGRFCSKWSEHQDAYYYRERATIPLKQPSGLKWQIGLINVLWEKWYELWKLRNEDVHGKDMASKAVAEKREVKRRLVEIYAMKNHIEPSAQALLCADIRTHLEQPTWVIQNWLTMYGSSYFKASAKKVTTLAIRGVPSIRSFFYPV